MNIDHNTMLIQGEDGRLYYKDGDETELASMTDIQKHYKTMQYNWMFCMNCFATDVPSKIIELIGEEIFNKLFWEITFDQIPENCERIK